MNTTFNYVQSAKKYGAITTLILALLVSVGIQAQTSSATIGKQTEATLGQVTTSGTATPGGDAFTAPTSATTTQGGSIRVVDNKGTKKYLQVQNGITQVTDTAPDGGIITTWQLGGQLASDTDIDLNGYQFSLDNVVQVDTSDGINGVAATAFTTAKGEGNTGWALLVRDEGTGEIKKLAATDLIVSGHTLFQATAGTLTFDVTGAGAGTANTGLSGAKIQLPTFDKIWVFRNGAKLIAGMDYTVSGNDITLNETPEIGDPWTLFTGDVIEIQYVK